MAVRLCQKQPVFRKWIVRAVSVWLIPIQKRSTNLNIIWYITRDEMICDLCMVNASWVSLTMTLKEAEWGWCDNCTLSLFGVGRVELAGTHPHFFSSGHNIDHWSGALFQQNTYLLFQQNTDLTHFYFPTLVIKKLWWYLMRRTNCFSDSFSCCWQLISLSLILRSRKIFKINCK